MHVGERVAARREPIAGEQRGGQRVGNGGVEVGQRGVDHPAQRARAEAPDGLIDRHDAAYFGGVGGFIPHELVLRIDHLQAPGPVGIDVHFAVQHDALPRLEATFEVAAVEELAVQHAGGVTHHQVIDRVAAPRKTHQTAADHFGLHGVRAAGREFADAGEAQAVFIAERQVAQQVLDRADLTLGQQRRALRSHALQVHDLVGEALLHES